MKNQKGFTLIELLIVIGIIAILAAAVIIAINPGQQFAQARNATRRSHMNAVANAVYSYSVENTGQYPPCDAAVTTTGPLTEDTWTDLENCAGLTPDYMSELPTDPDYPSGAPGEGYEIQLINNGSSIELRSDSSEWSAEDNVVQ